MGTTQHFDFVKIRSQSAIRRRSPSPWPCSLSSSSSPTPARGCNWPGWQEKRLTLEFNRSTPWRLIRIGDCDGRLCYNPDQGMMCCTGHPDWYCCTLGLVCAATPDDCQGWDLETKKNNN